MERNTSDEKNRNFQNNCNFNDIVKNTFNFYNNKL